MEKDLLDYLKNRRISDDTIQILEKEKMNCETISKTSIDILTTYFPTLGDSIAVKDFCTKKIQGAERKMGLVNLIRKKMSKKRSRRTSSTSDEEMETCSASLENKTFKGKNTRQVMVGWLCSLNGNPHKQVRLKQGGGTRKLVVDINGSYNDILMASKSIFFKDGMSSKGREENFSFAVWDFQQNPLGDYTIQEMYKITGLTRLRFYLVSTEKTTPLLTNPQPSLNFASNLVQILGSESENEDNFQVPTQTHSSPMLGKEEPHGEESSQNNALANNDPLALLVGSIFEEQYTEVNTHQYLFETDQYLLEANRADVPSPATLEMVLTDLKAKVTTDKISKFNIFRSDVFKCCLRGLRRKDFNPYNKISVKFSDLEGQSEGAIDEGGPKREMFRLLLNDLRTSNLFTGRNKKYISLNSNALREKHYFETGRIMALSLLHGGPGPHFMSNTLFSIIVNGIDNTDIKIDDVEEEIQNKLSLFEKENDVSKLQELILADTIFSTAGIQYISSPDQKSNMIKDVLRFYGYQRIQEALEQFIDGLKTGCVYDKLLEYPKLFEPLFCEEKVPLTANILEELFQGIDYSEMGSNKRTAENRAITYFRDYLLDCEEKTDDVSLTDILIFATGADTIPPLGFPCQARLSFLHGNNRYPEANTCALELKIPTCHLDYEDFKQAMSFAILNSNTFGMP